MKKNLNCKDIHIIFIEDRERKREIRWKEDREEGRMGGREAGRQERRKGRKE